MRNVQRILLPVGGIVAIVVIAFIALVDPESPPIPAVAPGLDQVCNDAMERSRPDLSWVARERDARIIGRDIKAVSLVALPFYMGDVVRVTGVLHAEFEWVALYPSRTAIEDPKSHPPWVALGSLWPDEPYWETKAPLISDRCVIIEGPYDAGNAHLNMFNGTIKAQRLDVWSVPHRPFITALPAPVR